MGADGAEIIAVRVCDAVEAEALNCRTSLDPLEERRGSGEEGGGFTWRLIFGDVWDVWRLGGLGWNVFSLVFFLFAWEWEVDLGGVAADLGKCDGSVAKKRRSESGEIVRRAKRKFGFVDFWRG